MQNSVVQLTSLGQLPSENDAAPETIEKYQELIIGITEPLTDAEAIALAAILGPDGCFGLTSEVVHKIETAPGWPIAEILEMEVNEGIRYLNLRNDNFNSN